jgi:hypothetical protein
MDWGSLGGVSERCTGRKYCKPLKIKGNKTTILMKFANRFVEKHSYNVE